MLPAKLPTESNFTQTSFRQQERRKRIFLCVIAARTEGRKNHTESIDQNAAKNVAAGQGRAGHFTPAA
jgi:hypothetical protein